MGARSPRGIAQSEIVVNIWAKRLPTVEAVRPACCPACGAASRPVGGRLGLYGDGTRVRTVRHPPDADSPPEDWVLRLRRYRCTACGAVTLVGPRGVLAHRRFTALAIALALLAWIAAGATARAVREEFSPIPFQSLSHVTWRGMLRWIDAIAAGRLFPCVRGSPPEWSRRQRAERTVSTIRAMAPPTERTTIEQEVFTGAFYAALAR
jgi:hypothetical protein